MCSAETESLWLNHVNVRLFIFNIQSANEYLFSGIQTNKTENFDKDENTGANKLY